MFQPVRARFTLSNVTKAELHGLTPQFGFNGLGELVFRRTYSRDNENWADVVIRVIEGVLSIRKEHYSRSYLLWNDEYWQSFAREMAVSMFNMEWLPPGRGLWMMGTDFAYERGSMALNNCAATETAEDLVLAAEWTMDALMNGVGVGFSTTWKGTATRPDKSDPVRFTIADSKEGWVESLIVLMTAYIPSKRYGTSKYPVFDYSQIRKAGTPIKGFGGTASGPAPLKEMHERIESFLDTFCTGNLDGKPYGCSRLVADVFNAIGACVVAGNVRRSAEICLGDVEDRDFLNLKNYEENPERMSIGWMSNNSVVLRPNEKFQDFSYIPEMARRICDNGEPGMINLYNIQKYGRMGKAMPDSATLVNPCFSGDTRIAVLGRRKPLATVTIKELASRKGFMGLYRNEDIGKVEVNMADGTEDPAVFSLDERTGKVSANIGIHPRISGTDKELVRIHFREGGHLDVTPSHECILANGVVREASHLEPGDRIPSFTRQIGQDGITRVYSGDTREFREESQLHSELKERFLRDYEGRHNYQTITGSRVAKFHELVFHRKDIELQDVHFPTEKTFWVTFRQNSLTRRCETCDQSFTTRWDLREVCFCSSECSAKYSRTRAEGKVGADLSGKESLTIDRVEVLPGLHTVYTLTTTLDHTIAIVLGESDTTQTGLFTRQCGEIALNDKELCNLAETFPPRCENPGRFMKALEYATFYASTVSLLPTHRPETNIVVSRNRRIGVSISGIAQWASGAVPNGWGAMNYTRMSGFLREAYKVVRSTNKHLAAAAGVPESVRVTTVKPSGSISLLAGVTPGVHYPVSRYAIRRVRIGSTSPLVESLKEAGVPYEEDLYSAGTYVFSFVIDHGDVRPCNEVSPWEQFSLVQMLQRHYADNCVSATIYFDKEKDGPDVEKMLAMYIPSLKSVSMLPHAGHGYKQAPYEPITEDEYKRRLSEFTMPTFEKVQANVPTGSRFCSGDRCEL